MVEATTLAQATNLEGTENLLRAATVPHVPKALVIPGFRPAMVRRRAALRESKTSFVHASNDAAEEAEAEAASPAFRSGPMARAGIR